MGNSTPISSALMLAIAVAVALFCFVMASLGLVCSRLRQRRRFAALPPEPRAVIPPRRSVLAMKVESTAGTAATPSDSFIRIEDRATEQLEGLRVSILPKGWTVAPDPPSPAAAMGAPASSSTIFCWKCGKPMPAAAAFCARCGIRLGPRPAEPRINIDFGASTCEATVHKRRSRRRRRGRRRPAFSEDWSRSTITVGVDGTRADRIFHVIADTEAQALAHPRLPKKGDLHPCGGDLRVYHDPGALSLGNGRYRVYVSYFKPATRPEPTPYELADADADAPPGPGSWERFIHRSGFGPWKPAPPVMPPIVPGDARVTIGDWPSDM